MEELVGTKTQHKMILNNRNICNITGVVDVLSFDVNEILLETQQGMLMIRGNDLHVTKLTVDQGEVDVAGKIDSLTYSENIKHGNQDQSIFARLFK